MLHGDQAEEGREKNQGSASSEGRKSKNATDPGSLDFNIPNTKSHRIEINNAFLRRR